MTELERWTECVKEFNGVLEALEIIEDLGLRVCTSTENGFVPEASGDVLTKLYKYFGVDITQLEKERRVLLGEVK